MKITKYRGPTPKTIPILWKTGPKPAWTPIPEAIDSAIDALSELMFDTEPKGEDEAAVAALVKNNTPASTFLGILRKKDTPSRWCIWK